ncbi:GDCCVxC domain-containing (seleno)protein [Roseibium sp.]|uniref:GDCCVxC domain-containing (seleno)protein n=1 Tax=Roseibium sp. TaxID=1936156 RepID=UPI003BAC3F6D
MLQSVITCPECGSSAEETMPENACRWFYDCRSCHAVLKPRPGDCCVFCSYATVPCPPVQRGNKCCG